MPHLNTLLATGFITDQAEEGTTFPSAGGNSADPKVQAVYWRCIVVLFASARFTNPEQRFALFTNTVPPIIDGVDIGEVLARYSVEVRILPLTARLAPGTTKSWGNVLYFHDIMDSLAATEAPDLRVAIIDADVLVTRPIQPLFALLDNHDFAGYIVGQTDPADTINGLSMRDMDSIARQLGGTGGALALHYGGELFLTSLDAWVRHHALFAQMLHDAMTGTGLSRGIITEEHIFTIAFAVLRGRIANANHLIKRIWTSPRYSSVAPGDERLLIWHLPAEKRYGLRDMFEMLRRSGFPSSFDVYTFRGMAMKLCGVPNKGLVKFLRDGLRQLAAKAGIYK